MPYFAGENEGGTETLRQQNVYGLVIPTNSFRILDLLLNQHKIESDIRIEAIAHAKSLPTYREEKPEIDANYMISSQPKLIFRKKQWIKRQKITDAINKLQIPDVAMSETDLILPSVYDGNNHRTTFALINPHAPLFKKMAQKGIIPRERLLKIHQEFRLKLQDALGKTLSRFMKASLMLMVDVNPGKAEMFSKDFVIGLRQPFMQKVVSTRALWECIDYEVF